MESIDNILCRHHVHDKCSKRNTSTAKHRHLRTYHVIAWWWMGYTHAMTTSTAAFDAALAKVVVYTDHTPTIYTDYGPLKGNITMAESCGLTCHIPTAAHPNTQKAFLKTAWAKAIGAK